MYAYRVYDPMSGRWTQRDPIGYQDSVNLYAFCGNGPVDAFDVDGRAIFSRCAAMTGHMKFDAAENRQFLAVTKVAQNVEAAAAVTMAAAIVAPSVTVVAPEVSAGATGMAGTALKVAQRNPAFYLLLVKAAKVAMWVAEDITPTRPGLIQPVVGTAVDKAKDINDRIGNEPCPKKGGPPAVRNNKVDRVTNDSGD